VLAGLALPLSTSRRRHFDGISILNVHIIFWTTVFMLQPAQCQCVAATTSTMKIFLLSIIVALCGSGSNACQSCLADLTRGLLLGDNSGTGKHHRHDHHDKDVGRKHASVAPITSSLPLALRKPMHNGRVLRGVDASVIGYLTIRKCIATVANQRNDKMLQTSTLMIQQQRDVILQQKRDNSRWLRILFASESKDDAAEKEKEDGDADNEVMSSSMIMAIGFYKKFISPLLPPACRFLPTCSQYGVQAIEKYGPQKGLILTAWRLARCSPFGGKGYDPPVWPPVSYTHGSY
jgi:putative membrane protein insertion efficiency factor